MLQLKKFRAFSLLLCLVLFALTMVLYSPVLKFDFLSFDDDIFVKNNPYLQNGFTWDSIQWAICADLTYLTQHADFWQPITFLSHLIDIQYFGLNAGAHHFSNVVYHGLNVLLFYFLLRRFGLGLGAAFVGGAIFAFHPLQVETVSWVVARKHMLGALWMFLSLHMYLSFVQRKSRSFYLAAIFFFLLSLLSKPNAIMLAPALLLIDLWPLERKEKFSVLFVEKIPFFFFTVLFAMTPILPFWSPDSGLRKDIAYASFDVLLTNASSAPFIQFSKFLLLKTLAFQGTINSNLQADWIATTLHSLILLASLWVSFCFYKRGRKALAFGWCWFLLFLIPTLTLRWPSDRFMYIPIMGLIILFTTLVDDLNRKQRIKTMYAALLSTVVVVGLMLLSGNYMQHWKNDYRFFSYGIAQNPDNFIFRAGLGIAYTNLGYPYEAMLQYELALKINDKDPLIYNNYGVALENLGQYEEAQKMYAKSLEVMPTYVEAQENDAKLKQFLEERVTMQSLKK